jgi:cytochrome c oxidase subunit IV
MDAHDVTAFKRHIRLYMAVFVALLVFTIITVAVSYFHFGAEDSHVGNVTVALIIAGFKAFLVGAFFMHLSSEKRSIYMLLGITTVFFLGMVLLIAYGYSNTPDLTESTEYLFHAESPPAIEVSHEP